MKQIITTAILILTCIATQLNAQVPFELTTRRNMYQPLENAISLNDGELWDDPMYFIPLGFKYKLNGKEVDTIVFNSANVISTDTSTLIANGYVFTDLDLADRGSLESNGSLSEIRYKVTGTPGNRICKIEMHNAGIYDELDLYGTMDDSVNIQVWLYEAGSKFEVHFGSSQLSHTHNYFAFGTGPLVGYAEAFDYMTTSGVIYTLSGSAISPTIDSISFTHMGPLLLSMPDDGTVYSFAPKTTSVGPQQLQQEVLVYPTRVSSTLFVDMGSNNTAGYRIIGTTGRTHASGRFYGAANTVDVSALPPGMYILQVHTDQAKADYRFIKM